MRSRFRSQSGAQGARTGRPLELVRVRGSQRNAGHESRRNVSRRSRRRPSTRRTSRRSRAAQPQSRGFWGWIKRLFGAGPSRPVRPSISEQEARALKAFGKHFGIRFNDSELLRLALTHRSYLSVTKGKRESNERLEFLGDSVLGLVTSQFLYQSHPNEHEGQLTKTKSLLVSKAILSRRALDMGLGRFVFMSHSEIESGGRQRLSILADAFEAVIGAIYLDQGFEAARAFIDRWLLSSSSEIAADKRHTNYKSHLQEYVQSTYRTHPVYRIRREVGPDHSKQFHVEVIVGRRSLGSGSGPNKKEAEQAAARDALERVESRRSGGKREAASPEAGTVADGARSRRRGRRGGRGRRAQAETAGVIGMAEVAEPSAEPEAAAAPPEPAHTTPEPMRVVPKPDLGRWKYDDDYEEVGRPEGPLEERHIDLYAVDAEAAPPETIGTPKVAPAGNEAAEDALEARELELQSEPESTLQPELESEPESESEPEPEPEFESELEPEPEPYTPPAASEPPASPSHDEPRYGRRRRGRR